MPVIVVGADTTIGEAIIAQLHEPDREIRVFVTDPDAADRYRSLGCKVALGDVSDDTHVEAASLRCFSAVLISEAAKDGRERSFAEDPRAVESGWASAVAAAGVHRVIWVTGEDPPESNTSESARVDPSDPDAAEQVAALDDAHSLG